MAQDFVGEESGRLRAAHRRGVTPETAVTGGDEGAARER